MHIVQGSALAIAVPAAGWYLVFVCVFTLAVTLGPNTVHEPECQQNIAASAVVTGEILSLLVVVPYPMLNAFGPLLMIRLILGFSVHRPSFLG